MRRRPHTWLYVACFLLAAAIFVVDVLVFPLGVAAAVPYVAVVLVSSWLPGWKHVLYGGVAVSALAILGYFWSDPFGVRWVVLVNRFIALFAIWLTAIVCYQRKRTEEIMHLRNRALETTNIGVVITDPNQHDNPVVYCSAGFERLTGYSCDEIVGRNCRILHKDSKDQGGLDEIRAAIKEVRVGTAVIRNYRKDGSHFWNELTISPVRNEDGRLTNFIGIQYDVTDRKRVEEALRHNEQELSHFFDNASVGLNFVSPEGIILQANQAELDLLGHTRDEYVGRQIADYHVDQDAINEILTKLSKHETIRNHHARLRCKDGSIKHVLIDSNVILENGEFIRAGCFTRDITERKQAAMALQESEEQLRAILNTASDSIITFDERGTITCANTAAEQIFGYMKDEITGKNVELLMASHYGGEHDSYLARILETYKPGIIGIDREVVAQRKNGSTFPVDLAVSKVGHTGLFTGIIRDISERKKLQRDVLRIAEDEQRRIGHDLHDSTQQELVGLRMLARTLLEDLSKKPDNPDDTQAPRLRELATKIVNGLARTSQDVRNVSRGLVPYNLDVQGLYDALHEFASRTDDLEGVTCEFKCDQPVEVSDRLTATHLYRIVQEATANALKHGHPKHILIALESDDGQIILQIADDGAGLDPTCENDGLGLKTMFYRANLIGASITVEPIKAGGTRVSCRVPGA